MDIRDFEGLTKYKAIVPATYILSWILMILGPLYFAQGYQAYCVVMLAFTNSKFTVHLIIMFVILIKSRAVFNRFTNPPPQSQPLTEDDDRILYGFIIPSYKEDKELLAQTLDKLVAHKRSKHGYLIFLAMEAHEDGADIKAQKLINEYRSKFKLIDFTLHSIRPNEQKGKASNVSWCAQHLEPILAKNNINPDNVFLTIMDADSWAPDVYFDIMEEHVLSNYNNRHKYIYQPPQIFTRNHMDVPVWVRVYDVMHSFTHCSNLYSVFGVTFPLSNYTLSYNLIKRIGFWDTCADAIGEDFHTTQKAYWKTQGDIETVPIYAPFNQVNISTGDYYGDVKARFWQAERHSRGVADLAWEFKMLFTQKFKLMNIVIFYQIFETFMLPALAPWVTISLVSQTLWHFLHSEGAGESSSTERGIFLIKNVSIISSLGYFMFEYFKRKSNTLYYNLENESLWRIFEYPILFMIDLFIIGVPTFVISAFGSLLDNREYVVAEKKMRTVEIGVAIEEDQQKLVRD